AEHLLEFGVLGSATLGRGHHQSGVPGIGVSPETRDLLPSERHIVEGRVINQFRSGPWRVSIPIRAAWLSAPDATFTRASSTPSVRLIGRNYAGELAGAIWHDLTNGQLLGWNASAEVRRSPSPERPFWWKLQLATEAREEGTTLTGAFDRSAPALGFSSPTTAEGDTQILSGTIAMGTRVFSFGTSLSLPQFFTSGDTELDLSGPDIGGFIRIGGLGEWAVELAGWGQSAGEFGSWLTFSTTSSSPAPLVDVSP
ncbi:MAG: hypothetical protein KC561_15715, partial [Myxococcales bacterium]|nr:hypothetical protein [Myxococcales bacterium]